MANLMFLGVGLAIFASMTGTIGKQLLRFSEINKQKGNKHVAKVSLTVGLGLNTAVGPIVDMMSYMFAPQSLIAPLGGLDVVWNTLIAPCTLGEKLNKTVVFGVCLIAGGATGTSFFGNHEDKEYNLELVEKIFIRKTVLFYLVCLSLWLLFHILVLQPRSSAPKGEPWAPGDPIRGLSLGLTAGSIAGNMFCVKAFIELVQASIRDEESEIWAHWLPYTILLGAILFAVTNLIFLTKAMREYAALFMGAVFEGSLITSACVSGIVVFSDLEALETYQICLYFLALSCIVAGIFTVAMGCYRPEEAEAEEAASKVESEKSVEAGEGQAGKPEEPGTPTQAKTTTLNKDLGKEGSFVARSSISVPIQLTKIVSKGANEMPVKSETIGNGESMDDNASNSGQQPASLASPFAGSTAFMFGDMSLSSKRSRAGTQASGVITPPLEQPSPRERAGTI